MLSPLPPISRKHRPISSFASDSCAVHPLQIRAQRNRRSTTMRRAHEKGIARITGVAAGQGAQKRAACAAQRAAWRQREPTRTKSTCVRYESSSAAREEINSPLCSSESFLLSARPPACCSPRRERRQREQAACERGERGATEVPSSVRGGRQEPAIH